MSYKIIVADNSLSVQKAIQLSFPSVGFEIYPLEDGAEVIKHISRINPDAILLSCSLRGKDGYEIGYYLKGQEEFRNIAIKPFDSGRLAQRVKNIIESKKNPSTLPEEPLLGAAAEKDDEERVQRGEMRRSSLRLSELIEDEEFREHVQDFINRHIIKVEKELEERIRKQALQDVKELIKRELEAVKTETSKLKSQK